MKIIRTSDYEEMSKIAAMFVSAQILLKPNCVLGLATGSSPLKTYDNLVKAYNDGILSFSDVRTVNLDEYCGLAPDHIQSYRYFMNENLFNLVDINKENTNVPDGLAKDISAECTRYEKVIQMLGGIDLQLLGIGANGHIAFNEPDDSFAPKTHQVQLTHSTIEANSRLFNSIEEVPTSAMTMGIGTIMKAKKIVLIAGKEKKDIVETSVYGKVTPQIPASILQLHPDATIILSD